MAKNTKNVYNVYSAWNYQKEVEDLNRASEQGWQLVKGGCFHSRFEKNPNICYRYQMDFGRIENMGRYIEMFREQGWEYINSTFNGWHYFRKIYDPSLPEEAYEIFTDRESLHEMNSRWARIALIISVYLAVCTLIFGIRMFRTPNLPTLVQLLTMLIEFLVLGRGVLIMRNPDTSRSRKGGSTFIAVFFLVIILGCTAGIILSGKRPNLQTGQVAGDIDEPIVDSRFTDFEVNYEDNYYLDLDIKSKAPLTLSILNEKDEAVYTVTETDFSQNNIRIKLPKGHYCFSMSTESGFDISIHID